VSECKLYKVSSFCFCRFRILIRCLTAKVFFSEAHFQYSSIRKAIWSLPSHDPTRRWPHLYSASYEGRPVRCFGPNDCVVHNSGIGPKTFQTKSCHQTLAVLIYTLVWLRLSFSCRVCRPTKYSEITKQSLIWAWFSDFVNFFFIRSAFTTNQIDLVFSCGASSTPGRKFEFAGLSSE